MAIKGLIPFLYLFVVHISTDYSSVSAFPNGAPIQACDDLSPSVEAHGAGPTPCPEPCPFSMDVREIIGILGSDGSTEYFCGSLHRSERLTVVTHTLA